MTTTETTTVKHTPGPWVVYSGTASDTFGVGFMDYSKSSLPFWLAKCHPLGGTDADFEVVKANARLIAAAPEMLEALEDIVQRLEDDLFLAGVPREQHKDQRHLKRLYKAIERAKGRA